MIKISALRAKAFWFVVIAVVLSLGVLTVFGSFSAARSASFEPYPSFTMTYKDWDWSRGPNQTPGYVIVRLTYRNSRDWESEILEDSAKPEAAGTRSSFKGDIAWGFNSVFNRSASEQYPPNATLAPADWLVRGRIAGFRKLNGARVFPATPGLLELVYSIESPCMSVYPASVCPRGKAFYIETRHIQFREQDELPMGEVLLFNSFLARQITIFEFTLSP